MFINEFNKTNDSIKHVAHVSPKLPMLHRLLLFHARFYIREHILTAAKLDVDNPDASGANDRWNPNHVTNIWKNMSLCNLADRSTQLTTAGFAGWTMRCLRCYTSRCYTSICEFRKHETKPAHARFCFLSPVFGGHFVSPGDPPPVAGGGGRFSIRERDNGQGPPQQMDRQQL